MTVTGFRIGIHAESHQEIHMGFSAAVGTPNRLGIIWKETNAQEEGYL